MFDRSLLKLEKGRVAAGVAVVYACINSGLILGQCFGISSAIVKAWQHLFVEQMVQDLTLFAACFICRALLKFVVDEYFESWASRNVEDLNRSLLDFAWSSDNVLIESESCSTIAQLLSQGSEAIVKYLMLIWQKLASVVIVPCVLAVAIFLQDWVSGIIVAVCYPFIMIFMNLIGRSAATEAKSRLISFEKMSEQFIDALRGLNTIKDFNAQNTFSKKIFASSELFREKVMKTLRIASLSSAMLDIFATGGLAAVAIMLGVRMVEGSMNFLPALFVLTLTPEFFLPVKRFANDYHATLDGRTALQKVRDTLMLPVQKHQSTSVKTFIENNAQEKGSLTVIIGKSGSGKTTALQQYVNQISDIEPNWQSRIAYIPQRPHLVGDTVKENARFYFPEASSSQIREALDAVDLQVELDSFANNLSAGQKHRLMIARALLDPVRDTWILDEPGANLDYETDVKVKQSLLKLAGEKTLIVTSHRLHWADSADRVVNLDDRAVNLDD